MPSKRPPRDLNSSWDLVDDDSQDQPYESPTSSEEDSADDISPLPQAIKRGTRTPSRNTTPTRPATKTPGFLRSTSVETSSGFVMPSPYSPPNTFNTRRRSSRTKTPQRERSSSPPRRNLRRQPPKKIGSTGDDSISAIVKNLFFSTAHYSINLLFQTLSWLSPFLAPLLAVAAVVFGVYISVHWASQQVLGQIPTSLSWAVPNIPSPCSMPFISRLPSCGYSKPKSAQALEFGRLMKVQDDFGRIVELSEAGSVFPLEFTRMETPLMELRDVIKYRSQLPSKSDLTMQFDIFVQLSRSTKRDLQTFGSHCGASTDKIIHMNRATLRTLAAVKEDHASDSIVIRALHSLTGGAKRSGGEQVLTQYLNHAILVERQTDALIIEGEALLRQLQAMDDILDSIREMAGRDLSDLHNDNDELFSNLWTHLGGNMKDRKRLKKNIAIADKIREHRGQAAHIVQLTVVQLRHIRDGIADLQARVMAPGNMGTMDLIEIEEHVRFVQDGLDRLYQKRLESNERVNHGTQQMLNYAKKVFREGVDGKQDKTLKLDA